ncbi:hypothetical protein A6R68_02049, partial [Neotoma lepida]
EKFEVTNLNMKSGMSLKIKGKIHKDVDRFIVNLGQGKDKLNLHFNPRFNESTIVCNSRDGGSWGKEHRDSHMLGDNHLHYLSMDGLHISSFKLE